MTSTQERPRLAALTTPLQPAFRLQEAVGGPLVWVRRDDLTGFATAGNKSRTLEFLIGYALARTPTPRDRRRRRLQLLRRHHGRRPGRRTRLPSDMCGEADQADPNLLAARGAGAHLHLTRRPDRAELARAVPRLAAELAASGRRPHLEPRGGADGYRHPLVFWHPGGTAAALHPLA